MCDYYTAPTLDLEFLGELDKQPVWTNYYEYDVFNNEIFKYYYMHSNASDEMIEYRPHGNLSKSITYQDKEMWTPYQEIVTRSNYSEIFNLSNIQMNFTNPDVFMEIYILADNLTTFELSLLKDLDSRSKLE
mmetsp:Transcript_1904/g.2682  ORF Transcript_1904/g.2682 Transcript_1904/m.2682 type:complete len:132 (+) Transcript_1904:568-963(+)